MAITRRLRFEILRRDSHTCRYCGAKAPDAKLTVDHVVPRALGGSDDPSNLVTACDDCNQGKASSAPDAPLVADIDADALRYHAAIQRAAEIRRNELNQLDAAVTAFDAIWHEWDYTHKDRTVEVPRPTDWRGTIEMFITNGLSLDDLARFIDAAMGKPHLRNSEVFRYFCGCCWREIECRHELARRIVKGDS